MLFCSRNLSFRYLALHGFDGGMVLRSAGKIWHEAKVTAKKKRDKLEGIVTSANIGQFHTKKTRFEVTISKTSFLGPNLLVRPHVVH